MKIQVILSQGGIYVSGSDWRNFLSPTKFINNFDLSNVNKPRFAVLMAARNGAQFIQEQITSILDQEGVDVNIFISLDQSTDETLEIINSLANSDSRICIMPDDGRIFGGAGPNFYRLITEVDFSHFDYVSFADQDDIWHIDKLFRANQIMAASHAQGYSSNFTAFWSNGRKLCVKKAYPQRQCDYIFESAGPGCTYVIRLEMALSLKLFILQAGNELLKIEFHDWLIYAFARHRGYKWTIDDWSSIQYRQHYNNQLGVNSGWRSFFLRANKILNGYGISQALLIANLIGANSTNIVRRGLLNGRIGYLWLSFQCYNCRRKKIDQIMFSISCLLMAIIHPLRSFSTK